MTEQEAINNIRLDMCDKCLENCARTRKCTFSLAIKALEKQTPRKPKRLPFDRMGYTYKDYFCVCDYFIGAEPGIKSSLKQGEIPFYYCPNCGQRLDWSEA